MSRTKREGRPAVKTLKIDMYLTEDQYRALEFACRYIPSSGKISSVARNALHLILLNAKPDGKTT